MSARSLASLETHKTTSQSVDLALGSAVKTEANLARKPIDLTGSIAHRNRHRTLAC